MGDDRRRQANGLEDKVGTLTLGKQADIVMLRTDRMNVTLNDPVAAVVVGMDTSNVDTVIVGGHILKRNGRLLRRLVDDAPARRGVPGLRDREVRLPPPQDMSGDAGPGGLQKAVVVVGLVAYLATGFVYLTSGLVVPMPWLAVLWVVWLVGLWLVARLFRAWSWWVLAAAPLAAAFWFLYLTAGERLLGWTG